MPSHSVDSESRQIANRWCKAQSGDWRVVEQVGRGGTAPVFEISSPDGLRALKLFDEGFSDGERGEESLRRLKPQLKLGDHEFDGIVKFYDGGIFEDRLYILMSRAPGSELEKVLPHVPHNKIRSIIDQIAGACIFLRSKGLCHRDIKSANIFVTKDFDTVTLLDLSVAREIHDPVGLGTDHDGKLPVVATSRYSPPEYLFRLISPTKEQWHALDIYQIGGLLHDLIMGEPLFETEYQQSSENRYRFAWIVATKIPNIEKSGVDGDLILLAKRALDKDWERRSLLNLEDFLQDTKTHEKHGLEAIGLIGSGKSSPDGQDRPRLRNRTNEFCTNFPRAFKSKLRENSVLATHKDEPTEDDNQKRVIFNWSMSNSDSSNLDNIRLDIGIRFQIQAMEIVLELDVTLSAEVNRTRRQASMSLPPVNDDENIVKNATNAVWHCLGSLSHSLMNASPE